MSVVASVVAVELSVVLAFVLESVVVLESVLAAVLESVVELESVVSAFVSASGVVSANAETVVRDEPPSAAIIASVVITLLVFIFFSYKNDVFYILLPFA